ncbi:hypothetical protein QAD02_014527, partial [Eretmocerus hayati]
LELLDFCYRQDDDQTQQLLTSELKNWSGQTCLSLAVTANHRALLAHPCSQIILADLWMGGLRTRKSTNFKVMLGLFFPVYITQLEFKSREELQLMPQTAEEHLIALEDENEDSDSELGTPTGPDVEALIGNEHGSGSTPKETIVHENGKVHTDSEDVNHRAYGLLSDYYDNKNSRPLKLKKKLYEFYTAPITKFWANAIAYVIFLLLFSYSILVRMGDVPSWAEIYAIAYICTMGCEKVREIATSEPVALSHKFSVWAWNMWNPCDAAAIMFFVIGLVLRLRQATFDVGRTIYCVDCMYWYLRMLNILGVNKYLGPLVTMMGKMVKNMIYFVVLLLVVLMSFGVARQAILSPNNEPNWRIIRDVFMEPYFMLYGEVYADRIDPDCGLNPGMDDCLPGHWITPLAMAVYLLVANILLINLLIAVFNNIFIEVNAVAHQVWMFQRFTVVMEYEQKPVLPPPFIIVSHLYLVLRYLFRYITEGRLQSGETCDNGLKLFLEADDKERLYDFEEDCVEGYFREQELKLQMSTEERVKLTTERVENMHSKIEDIDKKESNQSSSLQTVEFRMRKLEELNEQTLAHLGVIHRFMATYMPPAGGGPPGSAQQQLSSEAGLSAGSVEALTPGLPLSLHSRRPRRVSERSEAALSESESHSQLPFMPLRRKKLLRAMTDAAYLNMNAQHHQHQLLQQQQNTTTSSEQEDQVTPTMVATAAMRHQSSAPAEVVLSSGENLSRNDSSVSGGEPGLPHPEDISRDNTSHDESEAVAAPVVGSKIVHERTEPLTEEQTDLSNGATTTTTSESVPEVTRTSRQNSRTRSDSLVDEAAAAAVIAIAASMSNLALPQSSSFSSQQQRGVTWATDQTSSSTPAPGGRPSSSSAGGGGGGGGVASRSLLLAMRAEYTSITDELESYCGLLSPPRTPPVSPPPMRVRSASERSAHNPVEIAWQIENEHLRDAEECDYQQMEDLIQRSINVTREIEQTLARPAATRDSAESDPNDKAGANLAAPASETMC